jgi:anti-anti-sigma factor
MKLPTEVFGNVVVVHTPEELGEEQAAQLSAFLTTLDRVNVILDLDGTESIDSGGLTSLLETQESLRNADGDLRVSTSNKVNRKILEITRLDQHLEVYDSVIEAVKSFV